MLLCFVFGSISLIQYWILFGVVIPAYMDTANFEDSGLPSKKWFFCSLFIPVLPVIILFGKFLYEYIMDVYSVYKRLN